MPDNWNPETYRHRAKQWQEKAEAVPPAKDRDAYVAIAAGYTYLALLIEESLADAGRVRADPGDKLLK